MVETNNTDSSELESHSTIDHDVTNNDNDTGDSQERSYVESFDDREEDNHSSSYTSVRDVSQNVPNEDIHEKR